MPRWAYHWKQRRKNHLGIRVIPDNPRAFFHALHNGVFVITADFPQGSKDLVQERIHAALEQNEEHTEDLRVALADLHLERNKKQIRNAVTLLRTTRRFHLQAHVLSSRWFSLAALAEPRLAYCTVSSCHVSGFRSMGMCTMLTLWPVSASQQKVSMRSTLVGFLRHYAHLHPQPSARHPQRHLPALPK